MKRIFVLIAVVALLVAGTVSVLADPIHIGGGTLSAATLSPIHIVGGTLTAVAKEPVEPEMVLLSPIHIGGGT